MFRPASGFLRWNWLRNGAAVALFAAGAACSDAGDNAQGVNAPAHDGAQVGQVKMSPLCATADEAALIREFYTETRPGAVLPIPGRKLNMIESKIASGLLVENAVGINGTPERLAEVWRSIDAWGADTQVRLVVSIDGWHPFDFPSKTPTTQEKHNAGFYDVYAGGDDGVHIHLKPEDVKLIYAANLPGADGTATRSVNLYDSDGRLILGVYASKAGNTDYDEAAVEGFNGSWELISGMPRACAGDSAEG